jgi:two-component system NarL family response regulator
MLVDDHEQFRQYLAELLERQPGLSVVAQAAGGQAAVDLLAALGPAALPELMLVDVEMPGMDGIETTRRVLADHPGMRVIALSLHDDPPLVAAMSTAGASSYVLKSDPLTRLVRTVRDVAAGRIRSAKPSPG